MNQQKWQNFFSIRFLFIFFAIVVLPLGVTWQAIHYMINEQYQARKDLLEQQLDLQTARIPILARDDYQFRDFFDSFFTSGKLLKSSPKAIAEVLERIEKVYPGGFRWIFWDRNAQIIPVDSKTILEGKKSWEVLFANLMKRFNVLGNASVFSATDHFKSRMGYSLGVLQRAIGPDHKVEHLHSAREKVIELKWFGKDCLTHWNIDVVSYQFENVPKEIRGGCLAMAFKDALGENFWLKRMLVRRPRQKKLLPFPMVAINLSDHTPLHIEDSLRFPGISHGLIKAYIDRDRSVFEYNNYMVKAAIHEDNSGLRIFSLVDLSKLRGERDEKITILTAAIIALFIVAIFTAWFLMNREQFSFSLRKRIAMLFLIAVFLPVLSLVSIGRVFLSHEENRLYESAYLRMESGLEALELRYKDAPRLLEKNLFSEVQSFLGSGPLKVEMLAPALEKAVDADLIKNYIVGDIKGNFIVDNWKEIHPAIKNALKLSIKKLIEVEFDIKTANKSLISEYVDEEIEGLLTTVNASFDLSRPSHLRYYCFQDFHMYFMSGSMLVDGQPHALILHVPDYFLERLFVRKEFARNIMASGLAGTDEFQLRSELFFYSRFKANEHLPAKAELFDKLDRDFKRAFNLKVQESGRITFEEEPFLYLIMPLRTMFQQSYIPCMLTTTKQIDQRLNSLRLAIFILASFASLGAVLLSMILAGSLLGPIQSIDKAAQLVGKGDLSVVVPSLGNDELGRLSRTFNDMVKGLRERERMQAYVSDSVLEAVQDEADPNIGAGKIIQATILFSDIRNFTGLTETNRPEKIFELLNEFLGGVEPLIRENHGRVDKFIGDAVMAVFHQGRGETHALSAVNAAVAMKKFVKHLNLKRKKDGLFTINIGIGISTGMVLLGDVGSSRRKDLTVIGDEVNLAARLETASKQGRHSRIILSGSTYDLIKEGIEVEEMPFTEIRGKKQAVKIFELVKLRDSNPADLI
ncbi:MAG: adenylate/guanylate cyclase domain-containing protein [Candidatus Rifleibacteriota bacterium]